MPPAHGPAPAALSSVHYYRVASSIPQSVTISVNEQIRVSGLMQRPASAKTCLVLAHGAGAGMEHPFMAALAHDLEAIGIATLRFRFPTSRYEARGRIRPRFATPRYAPRLQQHTSSNPHSLCSPGQILRRPHDFASAGGNTASHVGGLVFFGFRCIQPSNRQSIEALTSPG